jgi:hypothetical protein
MMMGWFALTEKSDRPDYSSGFENQLIPFGPA